MCVPAYSFMFVLCVVVYVTTSVWVMFMYVVCAWMCFVHAIAVEVMVSLCLSWVNPHHLAAIGSFLLYWNSKWLNHTSYWKQSIFGSDTHSTSKPQIAPIKGPAWHAHTNTQLFERIWLVSISGRSISPFQIGLNPRPICTRVWTLKCVCMTMIHVHVSALFLCFDNKGASVIAVNVSC